MCDGTGVTWAAVSSHSVWMVARMSSTPAPTAASRWLAGAACRHRYPSQHSLGVWGELKAGNPVAQGQGQFGSV